MADKTREDIVADRRALKARFGDLYAELEAKLFALDPIGINYEDNTDEYDPEVRPILTDIGGCKSSDEILRLVHQVFVRMFDAQMAGARAKYGSIADWLWAERDRWRGR